MVSAKSRSHYAMIEKAKTIYGKRVRSKQYGEMFRCRNVPEISSYLKNTTSYADAFEGVLESSLHRGQLEHLLHRAGFEHYLRLYYHVPEAKHTLFRYVLVAREIGLLLGMLLQLKAENSYEMLADVPSYLLRHATIDLVKVASSKTLRAFIDSLEGSDYGKILSRFLPTTDKPVLDYAGCEYALYQYYYKSIFKMVNSNYHGQEREALLRFFRLQVETMNIEHIVRAKQLGTPYEELVRSLYPYHYGLSQKQLIQLLGLSTFAEIRNYLKETRLKDMFDTKRDYTDIEGYTRRYFYRYCRRLLRFSQFASVVFFAFYNLNQIELNNLTTVIEGIRYQVPQAQIEELLVL